MGRENRGENRIEFHAKSRAKSYRCRPNNTVRSFYVEKLSSFSYVNPEDPAHGYNLRSLGAKNVPSLNTSAIHTEMDLIPVALGDIIAILSETNNARGLSVRQIRDKLITRKRITEKVTHSHVRDALKKGIQRRRIKKVVKAEESEPCRSRSSISRGKSVSSSAVGDSEASRSFDNDDEEDVPRPSTRNRPAGRKERTSDESLRSLSGSRRSSTSGKGRKRDSSGGRSSSKAKASKSTNQRQGLGCSAKRERSDSRQDQRCQGRRERRGQRPKLHNSCRRNSSRRRRN
ncbi:hypothetical protein ElyMa_006820600 [Elysia marginata]|uniref:H15 domain-containing protein n=1 Tax=Elysia marginata TaxID=1093978 RepID=A0AAV4J4V7_9GAST|nr:hypothetical protein ElyMa_006820600 [Elysia marginata]